MNRLLRYLIIFSALGITINICLYVNESIYFSKLSNKLFTKNMNSIEKAIYANDWVNNNLKQCDYTKYNAIAAKLLYAYYRITPIFANVSAFESVEYGTNPHTGPCGSLSRVLLLLLENEGLTVRRFQIQKEGNTNQFTYGHTLIEIQMDVGYTAVFDPTFNLYWIKDNGAYASKEDLSKDDTLFLKGLKHNNLSKDLYPYNFKNFSYMRWDRIPFGSQFASLLKKTGIDPNNVPGIYIYDKSNLFLTLFFAFILFATLLYKSIRNNIVSKPLLVIEMLVIVSLVPNLIAHQLLINSNFTLIAVFVFKSIYLCICYFYIVRVAKIHRNMSLHLYFALSCVVSMIAMYLFNVIIFANLLTSLFLIYIYLKYKYESVS